ncbi:hypothetical protein VNO78_05205 [Psophocarpus tetragonolobus]|uniref:Uncharacterized protein n=1 Tax=Psophocarpus tetragonolobus TaxID=3891 RepID=A0AAN9XQR0_PSOTE
MAQCLSQNISITSLFLTFMLMLSNSITSRLHLLPGFSRVALSLSLQPHSQGLALNCSSSEYDSIPDALASSVLNVYQILMAPNTYQQQALPALKPHKGVLVSIELKLVWYTLDSAIRCV